MKTDFLGNTLNVGDEVVLVRPNYREFIVGTISKFTQCYVFVELPGKYCHEVIKQSPSQLIKKEKNGVL